jgi:hypothetical protein
MAEAIRLDGSQLHAALTQRNRVGRRLYPAACEVTGAENGAPQSRSASPHGALVGKRQANYRLTVNLLALLASAAVTTVTFTLPNFAVAGTLHLMRVAVQETYFLTLAAPNFT